jgi:hypothetical protein
LRIGILTYHAVYNFGANLQALSTFSYLKNEGHEPIIIDFFPKPLEDAFDKSVPPEQANVHRLFLREHFTITKRCRNASEVAREIEYSGIEAVIIGSDAVLQHYPLFARIRINPSRKRIVTFKIEPVHYETNFPNPFWGEFIDYLDINIPVAMMSVSCQNTDYRLFTLREKRDINKMINKISYITVRDKRTKDLFRYISKGTCVPKVTPDPVFGLNDNVPDLTTKEHILKKFGLPDKYILLSFNSSKTVSKIWVSNFEIIARQNGYNCVAFAMPGGIKFENDLEYKIDIPLDPQDWYRIIKFSSAYIGEKMHPVIVSLLNNVPFFCFDHYGISRHKLFLNQKASKIYQLLEQAKLEDYRISTMNKIKYKPSSPEYVFEKINSFDRGQCYAFTNQMRNEYKAMMEELILELK